MCNVHASSLFFEKYRMTKQKQLFIIFLELFFLVTHLFKNLTTSAVSIAVSNFNYIILVCA